MPISPSPNNYTLGKGIVYFDVIDSNGEYAGERDLGNAQSFNLSVAVEKLPHYSQRSGLKSKDKTVTTEITPSVAFVLDEINVENIALMFMGTTAEISQTADDNLTYLIDVSAMTGSAITGNRWLDVGEYRNIGVYKLPYDGGAVALAARGETIAGAGGATCDVLNLVPGSVQASGTMYVENLGGTLPFIDNEVITSSGTMTGVVNCPSTTTYFDATSGCLFDPTDVCISDDATNAVVYTKTTDYVVDSEWGRVKIVDGGALDGLTADQDIEFAVKAETYTKIYAFNETSIEGRLRFVPDNPVGQEMSILVWRVDLAPGGDVAMIGEDWQVLSFTGEVLKDETNHPTEPYYRIESTDTA